MSVMNIPRFFFIIMARSSLSHSYKRPNQSLASIHWFTYIPAVVVAVVFISSVVGVCMMYCLCFQPVRQTACGLLSVTACVERCVHSIWSASLSHLTLAYSLPTACPNKALNRLERLQTPKGVLKWTKNLTQLVVQFRFRNNLFIFPLLQSFWKRKFINN